MKYINSGYPRYSDPIGLGKPLRYSLKGHRRLRVGDIASSIELATKNER